jgi:hypothetical protein
MNTCLFRRILTLLLALAILAPSIGLAAKKSSSGGTVQVKGYYRKNGTYVQPHTRSAPGSGAAYNPGTYKPDTYKPDTYKPKSSPRTTPVASEKKATIPKGETLEGEVVGVTDGDTLRLLVDKTQYKIRLEGIDAPESGQPFGTQSKKALSEKVFGKTVRVLSQGQDIL